MIKIEHRAFARKLAHGLGMAFLGSVVVLWSWNTVASDLVGAPLMAFRHALALLLLVMTLAVAGGWAGRLAQLRTSD